jgi:hypothetical protein
VAQRTGAVLNQRRPLEPIAGGDEERVAEVVSSIDSSVLKNMSWHTTRSP